MSRLRSNLSLVLLGFVSIAAALGACNKTGSAPGGFGVNVTVDATGVKSADRATITTDKLTVVSDAAGSTPLVHTLADLPKAIQGGTVRFHYTPATGVKAGDRLTFGLDVLNGNNLVASGSGGPVTLEAGAVSVMITLASTTSDGGTNPDSEGGNGKGNGVACVTDDECGSGFCMDGVCCNEKCNDVCVSCNQATAKGTCTAYAANSDPEMECAAKLPPTLPEDAGTTTAEAGTEAGAEGGSADGGDAGSDATAATDADDSDAVIINTPDGGFMSMPKTCGGTCGGARACSYPGKTTSCGKSFCNTHREIGTFVCDGNGGCNIDLSQTCSAYACDDSKGACFTACGGPADCELGFYCSTQGTCLPKKVVSVGCITDGECKSDHCSSGVCCNTACMGTGLSCNDPGQAGQCKCIGVTCAAGVACQVFYRDSDSDTFGDMNGSIAAGTAKAGCMGSAPPVGFVADSTDCDDTDANAHPGQTAFFNVQRKSGGFDYDCDTKTTKETPEYAGGFCKFCGAVGTCDTTSTTCVSANETASFQCPQEYTGGIIRGALRPPSSTSLPGDGSDLMSSPGGNLLAPAAGSVAPAPQVTIIPPICKICILQCCGCAAADKTGFRQVVACGDASIPQYTCGSCAAAGGFASAMTPSFKQQRCR